MASEASHETARTPVHLWIVGVAAALWNSIGAVDYTMSRTHNEGYFRALMPDIDPAAIFAYVDNMPLLASIGWALGVWGAVAGTLLLLARSRHAVAAYLASVVGAIGSFFVQAAGYQPPKGMDGPIMPIIITVIAMALLFYAHRMKARGVLR